MKIESLAKPSVLTQPIYEPGKPITLLKDWGNLGLRVDGWVSLEVSPTLAYDTASTLAAEMPLVSCV